MLAYLGKIAEQKIESTNAYAYAQKQYDKITTKAKDEVKVDVTETTDAEKLHLKLGKFEIVKDVKKENSGFYSRLEKLYKSVKK